MPISAGELNKRIAIQQNQPVEQLNGSELENWTTLRTVWSDILSQGAREFYQAQKKYSEVTKVFKIRYFAGLTTKHRIQYSGRIFDILGVDNVDEASEQYLISAKEVI
ncbi:MAG TPA: phage head closure protein [Pseudobacteroides sp.]|uniref:phage head closure protein n=1 Tax=Pseudobacteroides sp. TaxID=1968840 RepID=UPI002F93C33E